MAIELIVPMEAPKQVAALLAQASRDGCIENEVDAAAVWKELVSVASLYCSPESVQANLKKAGGNDD